MELVILSAVLLIVLMTALQVIGSILGFLWKVAPTIVFIIGAVWYSYDAALEERKNNNARHSRLSENQSQGGGNSKEWLYDKTSSTPKPRGESK